MKKAVVWMLMILIFLLCGCTANDMSIVDATTIYSTAPDKTEVVEITFHPQDIRLKQDSHSLGWTFGPLTKRYVYYAINLFTLPIPAEAVGIYFDELWHSAEPTEMAFLTFIKEYSIHKEVFEEAIRVEWEDRNHLGLDMTQEEYELPNPDIIYTFDNEIINAYYRRENPVAPKPGTYKTYESYEEYKKANP